MATQHNTRHYEEITNLPFVSDTDPEARTYWDAKYTGSSEEDYAIGEMYAIHAMAYAKQTGSTHIVNWAMQDMPEKHTRLEHAFFNTLVKYAARGL